MYLCAGIGGGDTAAPSPLLAHPLGRARDADDLRIEDRQRRVAVGVEPADGATDLTQRPGSSALQRWIHLSDVSLRNRRTHVDAAFTAGMSFVDVVLLGHVEVHAQEIDLLH